MPSSISDGAAAVEFLDEKVIKSNGQPPEATNPTKHANVRWADSVKRAYGKVGSGIASFLEKPVLESNSVLESKSNRMCVWYVNNKESVAYVTKVGHQRLNSQFAKVGILTFTDGFSAKQKQFAGIVFVILSPPLKKLRTVFPVVRNTTKYFPHLEKSTQKKSVFVHKFCKSIQLDHPRNTNTNTLTSKY